MKRLVVTAHAITIGILTLSCARVQPATASPLVGAWRSSLQVKSGAFGGLKDLEFMYVFNAGGTMTESSNYDGAPPVPPAYGVWREVGPNDFEARYEFYATTPDTSNAGGGWLPSGRGVFTERIIVSTDGRTFTSSIRYEALGLRGETLEGSGEAEGRGVRMGF